ncbi:DedA family protein [Pseudonocardiaceae bacterium YIM PH 21723]|nr:DedA family protein [Pseudonocardiaceae bacterium YIM PH 21723]
MEALLDRAMAMPWLVLVIAIAMILIETSSVLGLLVFTDSTLLAVGALGGQGLISLWLALPLMIAAAILADLLGLRFGSRRGRTGGESWLSRLWDRYSAPAGKVLRYRNGLIIPIARLVPYVRTVIPISAGVSGMSPREYLGKAAIGIVVWVLGVTLMGAGAGQVFDFLVQNQSVAIAVSVLGVLALLATAFHQKLTGWFLTRVPDAEQEPSR